MAQKKLQIKGDKDFEDQTRDITVQLIKNMHNACVMDYESIKKGKSARYRFQMMEEVSQLIRKKHIQSIFLEMHGCRFLEMWISLNPDGSFPPIQLIDCVISILDSLPINQDHLESCQVARALTTYAQQSSQAEDNPDLKLPQDLISKATKLLQKWQTVVFQLSYEYDQDGMHEIKQRDLRRRLEVLREME